MLLDLQIILTKCKLKHPIFQCYYWCDQFIEYTTKQYKTVKSYVSFEAHIKSIHLR